MSPRLDPSAPPPPYPIQPGRSNYVRRAWWRGFEMSPGVTLKTTARLRPALAARAEDDPWALLYAVTRAACAALSLHPRLNYCPFWGRLHWAGWPPRVMVVLERGDAACDSVVLPAAWEMDDAELARRLRERARPAPPAWWGLRELLPEPFYLAERMSGHMRRRFVAGGAPLFVSMLGLRDIEELSFTVAHAMALYPAWPQEGRLGLTLCFPHVLANARPVGRLLLTIKDLLE